MGCACIKGFYDFKMIPVSDGRYLYFDTSLWMEGERYSGEKEYDLNIENLESGEIIQAHVHDKEGVDLYIDDGVYLFRVNNCETPYYKYGVSIFFAEKLYENLVIQKYDKEIILELKLEIDRLKFVVNSYIALVDKDEVLEIYNDFIDYINLLKCKI